jgi:hypothetical protein
MNPKQDLLNIYQCDRIIFTQEGDSSGLIYLFGSQRSVLTFLKIRVPLMNETTQNCIFGLEMKDVLDFKNYIAELPPIRDCNDVSPEIERRLKAYWYWLGESLDAFFLDKPDPLVRQGLSEVFREFIQRHSNRYLMWTIRYLPSREVFER